MSSSSLIRSRRGSIAAASALCAGLMLSAVLAPAQAQAATPDAHSVSTSAVVAAAPANPFTVKTYGGSQKKSFDGIRFAGTATPGSLVLVYYDAPGPSTGLIKGKHIAEGQGTVGASGYYSFTASFPDLPLGATTLSYHARLVDPGTLEVIGRVDGVRKLG